MSEQMLQLVIGGSCPNDLMGTEERRGTGGRRNELHRREEYVRGSCLSPVQESEFEGWCLRDSSFLKIMFSAG